MRRVGEGEMRRVGDEESGRGGEGENFYFSVLPYSFSLIPSPLFLLPYSL